MRINWRASDRLNALELTRSGDVKALHDIIDYGEREEGEEENWR